MAKVNRLHHGGIMANYRCTAACRHCLYSCSPERVGGYITKTTAEAVCLLLRDASCRSIHIGGGEPFLDFSGLLTLVQTAVDAGISVEYIETNAFWAGDRQLASMRLKELAHSGADTLCISIDPFHAEYVPVDLPLSLAETCKGLGFGYFLWQERFYPLLSRLDGSRTYSRAELERHISPKYIIEAARGYGLHIGGRAISIEAEYSECLPVDAVISRRPCSRLLSGDHFHVDLYGRYIPPGCTGIAIPLDDAVRGIPESKYPAFEALLIGGTAGLMRYAEGLGFVADPSGYPSSCTLCFHIRRWLCENSPSPELDHEHYLEAMKYW